MFMKKVSLISFTGIASLAFFLSGCGSSSAPVASPWASNPGYAANGCPTGTISNGGYCLPYSPSVGTDFSSSSCASQQLDAHHVQLTCAIAPAYYVSSSVFNFPYLPSASQVNEAWWGPSVKANDEIHVEGSFVFGTASWKSLFGSCSSSQDGTALMKGALGSNYFALPMNQAVIAPAAGVLRFGLDTRHSCLEYSTIQVRLIRTI